MTPLGREWVRKAEVDRRAVRQLLAARPKAHGTICYLCQQLAEKYLKGLLHERGHVVPRTHDCELLIHRLTSTDPTLGALLAEAIELSRFAVEPRYPGFWPDAVDSKKTWASAERIRSEVRRRLGLRPRP
jgi:HEPN domain-containing protein